MDRRSFMAGGAAFWAVMPQLAIAQVGWVLLGSRTVNWAAGRDSILVRPGGPIGALSFRTRGGEIFITSVDVSFSRGPPERVRVNMRVRSNVGSNIVRLRAPRSDIRRIDYRFRRASPRGPAMRTTVEVFGRR